MSLSPLDLDLLQTWVGRSSTAQDVATPVPAQALSATLDRDDAPAQAGQLLPPCWHWLYFLPLHRQSDIDADGHPKRGGFLPPVPLPRRMWAGSQLDFLSPIRLGQLLSRRSSISDVQMKQGRSGPLVFVKLRHELAADGLPALIEHQDLVYRGPPGPGEPASAGARAPADAAWTRRIVPDEVLLFRYSALTFNGHRIHYDRRHATEVEAYPDLVVHGPLIATLLLDLLRRQCPSAEVGHFEFRALRPLFAHAPFELCGRLDTDQRVRLWAQTTDGQLAMDAHALLT